MAPDLAQRIAIHEAGHVVAATHCGPSVVEVTVRPSHGTTVEEDLYDAAPVGVMVATAGVVAEDVLYDLETQAVPSGPDDGTRFRAWNRWGGDLGGRPRQHLAYQSARNTAENLMNSHKHLVEAVASVIRAMIDGNGHTVSRAQLAASARVVEAAASCPDRAITFR